MQWELTRRPYSHVKVHRELHLISHYYGLFCKPNKILQIPAARLHWHSCLDFINFTQLFIVANEFRKRVFWKQPKGHWRTEGKIKSAHFQTCSKGKATHQLAHLSHWTNVCIGLTVCHVQPLVFSDINMFSPHNNPVRYPWLVSLSCYQWGNWGTSSHNCQVVVPGPRPTQPGFRIPATHHNAGLLPQCKRACKEWELLCQWPDRNKPLYSIIFSRKSLLFHESRVFQPEPSSKTHLLSLRTHQRSWGLPILKPLTYPLRTEPPHPTSHHLLFKWFILGKSWVRKLVLGTRISSQHQRRRKQLLLGAASA